MKMTDAYFVHDDNYDAMKKDRDSFNRNIEQKLAEAENEELAAILSTFVVVPPTTKILTIPKQQEDSD